MSLHLPFEPPTALDSLQRYLPPFVVRLAWPDIRDYIIDGHVQRKVVLTGRFGSFGYTISILSAEDATVESLLNRRIPRNSAKPLYDGQASGFFIKGKATLFKRGHHLNLTQLESGAELILIYQRPSIWQTFEYGRDVFYGIRYDDEFEDLASEAVDAEATEDTGILRFFAPTGITMSMVVEAFKEGVDKKSRFGYTRESIRAMQGLALAHQILHQFTNAERVLSKALALAHSAADTDTSFRLHILYYYGELYLDQGKLEEAEKKFLLVEKAINQHHPPSTDILQLQLLGSLASLAIRQQRLQRAQSLLERALVLPVEPDVAGKFQHLVLKSHMGVLHLVQDRMSDARALCESTLAEQEAYLGHNHYHTLRSAHCLARILFEQDLVSESKTLYQRQLLRLRALLGSRHHDTLKTIEHMARILHESDDFQESRILLEELCEEYDSSLGGDHPATCEAYYQLAQTLKDTHKESAAIDILERLFRKIKLAHRLNRPESRRVMFVLELLYRRVNNLHHAEILRQELQSQSKYLSVTKTSNSVQNSDNYQEVVLRGFLELRTQGTCIWLLKNRAYLTWLASPQSSLLFLHGGPGTGKTILSSTLVESLRNEHRPTIFFFFNSTRSEASNAKALLISLIGQMQDMTGLGVKDEFQERQGELVIPALELFEKFCQSVAVFNEIFCCIDAVDECDNSVKGLLRLIDKLVQSGSTSVKFFLSGRLQPNILHHLKSEIHTVEMPNDSTVDDVGKMVTDEVRSNSSLTVEDRSKLVERVKISARGMFLWAKLALSDIEMDADTLPKTLGEMYSKSLKSLTSGMTVQELALLCMTLNWITITTRPLKVAELVTALAVEPSDTKLERSKMILGPEQSILKMGAPLIQILPDNSVVLVHQSLVDYLCSHQAHKFSASSRITIPIHIGNANEHLAITCISYLSFDQFTNSYGSQDQETLELLDYAATSWFQHAIRAGEFPNIFEEVNKFVRSPQGFEWLDGLLTYFGKSVEDLLVIQAQLSQWANKIDPGNSLRVFVLDLYRQKAAEIEPDCPKSLKETSILFRSANVFQATGNLSEAQTVYERALYFRSTESDRIFREWPQGNELQTRLQHQMKLRFPNKDHDVLKAWGSLASTYRAQGRWREAEELQTRLVERSEKIFGLEHPLSLTSKHSLAITYYQQGRWKEAESLLLLVVDGRRGSLGSKHPETVTSMGQLALVYVGQGRYQEAEVLNNQSFGNLKERLGMEHPETLRMMQNVAAFYHDQGRYDEAEKLYLQALAGDRKILGEEHPDTLTAMNDLAQVYLQQRRNLEAEKLYLQALAGNQKILGEEHPDTLIAMKNLAQVYLEQGRYLEAQELFERSLIALQKTLGVEHPYTLQTMQYVAVVYRDQGRYDEAEKFYLQALAGDQKVFGQEHPDTINVMGNLASIYVKQGRYEEAEALCMRTLTLLEKTTGRAHLATLDTVNNLGSLYRHQGKFSYSEDMFPRALLGYEQTWGSEHTSTLDAVNTLGYLYADQGKLAEAEAMYRRALEGYKKLLGPKHTSTLVVVNNLGNLYADQGKLAEAEAMYRRALKGYEELLGSEHISTLDTVNHLGNLYTNQGKLVEAEAMYRRALEGYEKLLGPKHMSTLAAVNNLGTLYADQGKLAEAEAMYRRALEGYEQTWWFEHPFMLAVVNNLGKLYANQGKLAEAEAMYRRALKGYEQTWGSEHTSTLVVVNKLGNLYADQGKLTEAEAMYRRALEGYEKVMGPEHIFTLDTVNNLGNLYADQGKLAEAEAMCRQALEGYEKSLGPLRPTYIPTLDTVNDLGDLYTNQGKLVEAEAMYRRALEGYEKSLGPKHRSILAVINKLGNLYTSQGKLTEAEEIFRQKLKSTKA